MEKANEASSDDAPTLDDVAYSQIIRERKGLTRDDLLRRLAEVQEGIEAATETQDFRLIGQLARERDRLRRELDESVTEEPPSDPGDRLSALEAELRDLGDG